MSFIIMYNYATVIDILQSGCPTLEETMQCMFVKKNAVHL